MKALPVKKILSLMAVLTAMSLTISSVFAASPAGFTSTEIKVNAQVGVSCQEIQQGAFPSPLIIDTQTSAEQTFTPSADELVRCTNGTVFTVKVSSTNGSAIDQTCTSGGVANMVLKSASWPSDNIGYIFMCAGDTDGTGHFTGAGFATAKAMGIGIKILAAEAQAALAHADYSDMVTLTISY